MYNEHQKLKQESNNQYLNDTSILIRDEAKYLAEQILNDETFKDINNKITHLLNESNKKDIEIKNISNILNNKYDFFLNKLEEKISFFLDNNISGKNEMLYSFAKEDLDNLKINKQSFNELSSKTFLKKLLIGFFEAKNIFFDILHSFFDVNDLQQQDIRNELNNSVQEFKVFIDDVSIVVESLKTFEAKNFELIQKNEKQILYLFDKLDGIKNNENKFLDNINLISKNELNNFQDSKKYLNELNKVWEEQAIFFSKLDKLTNDKDIISEKLNNLIEENNIKNNSVVFNQNVIKNSQEEQNFFSDDLLNIIQNQNLISDKFQALYHFQKEQELQNKKFIENIDLISKKDLNNFQDSKNYFNELNKVWEEQAIFFSKLDKLTNDKDIILEKLNNLIEENNIKNNSIIVKPNVIKNPQEEENFFSNDLLNIIENQNLISDKFQALYHFQKEQELQNKKFTENIDLISKKDLSNFQDSKNYFNELNKVWEEQAIFFSKLDKLTNDKDIILEKLNNLIEENNIKNNSVIVKPNVIKNPQEEENFFSNDLLNIIQNQNLISEKFQVLHGIQKEQELQNRKFTENIDLLSGTILNYFNNEKPDDVSDNNFFNNIDSIISNDKFLEFIDNKLFNSIEKYEVLNSNFYDKVIDNITLLKKAIEEEFIFQKKLFFSEIEKINLFLKNKDIDNLGIKVQNNSDFINKIDNFINSTNIDNIISSKMIEIVNNSISDVESKINFLKKDIENILLNKNLNTNNTENNNSNHKIKNESLSKIFSEITKNEFSKNIDNNQEIEEIKNDYKLLIENLRILNTIENLLKDQFLFQKNLTDEKKNSISENINKINLLKENISEVTTQINSSSFSEILNNSENDLARIGKINEETYMLIQKSTMELVKNEINNHKLWENNSSYFDNKIKCLLKKLNCKNI